MAANAFAGECEELTISTSGKAYGSSGPALAGFTKPCFLNRGGTRGSGLTETFSTSSVISLLTPNPACHGGEPVITGPRVAHRSTYFIGFRAYSAAFSQHQIAAVSVFKIEYDLDVRPVGRRCKRHVAPNPVPAPVQSATRIRFLRK